MFYSGLKSAVSFSCQPFSENVRGYFYGITTSFEIADNTLRELFKGINSLPGTQHDLMESFCNIENIFYYEYKISYMRPGRFLQPGRSDKINDHKTLPEF